MNEVLNAIFNRRSITSYKTKKVPSKLLNEILKAGVCAPSVQNNQTWYFTAIISKEALADMNAAMKEALLAIPISKYTSPTVISQIGLAKKEDYNFFYNAPVLIVASNDKNYLGASADCALALENIFLASHSLGLGSCWVNQLSWQCNNPRIRKLLTAIGIPEHHNVYGSAALGYANEPLPPLPRKDGVVNIIN